MTKHATKDTHPRVYSPAQAEARFILGRRWNLASILAGFICLVTLTPFIGLLLGLWFVHKARTYGHKAPFGVVLVWINAVATLTYILMLIRLLDVVFNGANPPG